MGSHVAREEGVYCWFLFCNDVYYVANNFNYLHLSICLREGVWHKQLHVAKRGNQKKIIAFAFLFKDIFDKVHFLSKRYRCRRNKAPVMTWYRQATSHCLSPCLPRYKSPYGIIRPRFSGISIWRYIGSYGLQRLQINRTILISIYRPAK